MLKRFAENYRRIRSLDKGKIDGAWRDGIISHHFNRRLSAAVTALLLDTRATPNKVSAFHLALGVLTCVPLYLSKSYFVAGLMVWVVSILDGVDGEIARAKGLGTKTGEFIDSFFDRLFDITIIFSIALSTSWSNGSVIPWIFAQIALTGIFLDNYVFELYGNRVSMDSIVRAQIKITKKLRFWPARDVFLFIISIASFFYVPEIGLAIAGILSVGFSLSRLLVLLRTSGV